MFYYLHMPSYVLAIFTECPKCIYDEGNQTYFSCFVPIHYFDNLKDILYLLGTFNVLCVCLSLFVTSFSRYVILGLDKFNKKGYLYYFFLGNLFLSLCK